MSDDSNSNPPESSEAREKRWKDNENNPGLHDVVVPVFLKVRVMADGDLHAESRAVEALRSMGEIRVSYGIISLGSVLCPLATKVG